MRVTTLVLVAVLALANYRIVRFLIADSLIDEPRVAVLRWLAAGGPLRHKLYELATCPYCLSVWTGAAVFALTWAATPIELPLLALSATWGATMVVWRIVE
jgi:hypothetical protein